MGTTTAGLGIIAMLVLGGSFAYYAYSQKDAGGSPSSDFSYTLTHSTTTVQVPKGDVLVVIPRGANENSSLMFKPVSIKVELGVNSTILFYDNDTYEHIIQSIEWPAGPNTFQLYVLPGKSVPIQLNATGLYAYNFELGAPLHDNGTITVVSH